VDLRPPGRTDGEVDQTLDHVRDRDPRHGLIRLDRERDDAHPPDLRHQGQQVFHEHARAQHGDVADALDEDVLDDP
jgi:hypothetical protein